YPAWRAPPAPTQPALTMRWLQTEYLLKGIYLGLVLYAALQQASIPPESSALAGECLLIVNLLTLAGLGAALVLAGLTKLREGFRVKGRLLPFILFLLLESPTLAYLRIPRRPRPGVLPVPRPPRRRRRSRPGRPPATPPPHPGWRRRRRAGPGPVAPGEAPAAPPGPHPRPGRRPRRRRPVLARA